MKYLRHQTGLFLSSDTLLFTLVCFKLFNKNMWQAVPLFNYVAHRASLVSNSLPTNKNAQVYDP